MLFPFKRGIHVYEVMICYVFNILFTFQSYEGGIGQGPGLEAHGKFY